MPVKVTEREYRMISATIEVRADQNGKMIVEGYATTFDEEYMLWGDATYKVMESIARNAFDKADRADVIMQYDHAGPVFARTANGTLTVEPDNHGLKIVADLGGTERGRQLYEEIKGGYTTKMSFGFKVRKAERTVEEDEMTGSITVHRKITEIEKLYDVSAVSLPANDATEISARSLCEGVIAEVKQERLAEEARARKKKLIAITAESI